MIHHRLIVAQTLIQLIKIIRQSRQSNKAYCLGREVDTYLVSGAVLIGHATKRPRTAAQISRLLKIPRPTVIRKLNRLVHLGFIEKKGTYYQTLDRQGFDYSPLSNAAAVITQAARELENLSRTHKAS